MTLLVTGGTGFLGSYLTRYALEEGSEEHVVVFDRYAEPARIADVLDKVTLVEGDVADTEALGEVIAAHNIDRIAHFAFILGSPSPGQMIPYVRVQMLGTANVFEAARLHGVRRVLFASSVAAYGVQDADVLTEDLVCNPDNPYGAAKLWGESLANHYTQELDTEVVTLRFGSTYGLGRAWRGSYSSGILDPPGQTHYMARVENAVRGEAITMPRDNVVADWTYAADAAKASWLALTADYLPHHLYNVGAERRPVGEFTQAMRELLPDAEITVSQTEAAGNPHHAMDASRLRADLGFTQSYTLKSGLEDYIQRVRLFDSYQRENARHTPWVQ